MASAYYEISSIMPTFFVFLLLATSSFFPVHSYLNNQANRTLPPSDELQKLDMIRAYLQKINKPSTKTIQSPDGDLIDCVLSHQQPAFDHPRLKGQKPLDPPKRPKGEKRDEMVSENYQLWSSSGESCPEGTIPIRRTTEQDVLRAGSVQRFGRKTQRPIEGDSGSKHEHSVGTVTGQDRYYGAQATINVWAPQVANPGEFSLAQMWIMSGSYGSHDLNTIEAGWQVYPNLYGDSSPRLFVFWTRDAYQQTGCYNLVCSGFVQTSNGMVIGGALPSSSSYQGNQYEISLSVWKDPKSGNWWLERGSGDMVGYWPSDLFTSLSDHADTVEFGGEVVNTSPSGTHTSTQMGSGHFSGEGSGKAAYFRDLKVVDGNNNLIPVSSLQVQAESPNCYDITQGTSNEGGISFYYGGPGRNAMCP